MVALRVLMLVEDTLPVISAAATMAFAGAPTPPPAPGSPSPGPGAPPPAPGAPTPAAPSAALGGTINLPPQMQLDDTFAPVPMRTQSAGQALAAAGFAMAAPAASPGSVGPGAYVVRGLIDAADLDAVTRATQGPGGQTTVFADPAIGGAVTCGGNAPVGTATDVQRLLQVGRLRRLGMDGSGVALAIVDTGINLDHLRARGMVPRMDFHASWTPQVAVPPGAAPVDHGTMCAFDALLAAPNATLLDYALLRSTRQGGSVMDGVLSDAVQAYGVLLRLMLLPEDERFFHSLVVSNSWGMFHPTWDFPAGHPGRYFDNPLHPFNDIVGSLAAEGADIVFAAGNCGPTCPDRRCTPIPAAPADRRISGANGHPDVLCVAGTDTQRTLVGYSTHGPGALDPNKPDLTAYTHFLGSEAFGKGAADSGTSTACPVAAGVIAALRSKYPYVAGNPRRTPGSVRQYLNSKAVQPVGVGAGWNPQTGNGIIDCVDFDNAGAVL